MPMVHGQDCSALGQIRYAGLTDPGKKRFGNEDSLLMRAGLGLFAVADGLGGLDAGDVASRMALEHIEAFSASLAEPGLLLPALGESVKSRVQTVEHLIGSANKRIYEHKKHLAVNMATTLAMVQIADDGMVVAHVGDSRVYLYRRGSLHRLTSDHSLVNALRANGTLTCTQAESSPQRHIITKALGAEQQVSPSVGWHLLQENDQILLCTDGLTTMLQDDAIARILDQPGMAPDIIAQQLVDRANVAGGFDNITVILISFSGAR